MKGLVFEKNGVVVLKDVDKPVLQNDTDAIVRITLTTICGSDVHLVEGHIPTTSGYVLGHEYVGVIESLGKNIKNLKPGDRVAGPAAPYCGQCENCKKGNIAHCLNGGVHGSGKEFGNLDGTHSEFIRVPNAHVNLLPIPDDVSDEQAIFTGDILSTGYSAVKDAQIKMGDTVVVFGGGPVGLCAVEAARLFNPGQIILVGHCDGFRMEVGKSMGTDHTILSSEENAVLKIFELTNGKGADAAIDAAGSNQTLIDAVRCVGIGGRVSLAALYAAPVELPMQELCMKNIQIKMGLGYLGDMDRLMKMIEKGKIKTDRLITHRMALKDIEKAFEIFRGRTEPVIKILIKP
ncbi:MAG TPA: alcohol dehydrogenase catalytic domain-containing protein [Anaerovoracaceae bacterium]|nr:alcohol dehydrogenase catalytic domain-containing protein [Anaerovoracaceae bacterium]